MFIDLLSEGMAIKMFKWKKIILCIKSNIVLLIFKKGYEIEDIVKFCEKNNLKLIRANDFTKNLDEYLLDFNNQSEGSQIKSLEFLDSELF